MTNVCVITAPALIAAVRHILADTQYTPATRIRPIRDRLERREADPDLT